LATIARAKLLYGDLEGTKTDMDKAWAVLDRLEGVDNGVNAAYYQVAGDYYKVRFLRLSVNYGDDIGPGESRIRAVLPTLASLPRMCS
jgi:26S proteasome regulatory subunit N9